MVCDASYMCQWEALERQSLAQMALLPHMDEQGRSQYASPDQVRAEFDAWLGLAPDEAGSGPQDELRDLLGVGRRR